MLHPQQQFCYSDFVVRLEAVDAEEIYSNNIPRYHYPTQLKYTVNISRVYKGSGKFDQADQSILFTGGTEAACRADLELGTFYIVTGFVFGNQMHFGMCGWYTPLADLSLHHERGIQFRYQRGCNCQIRDCRHRECDEITNTNDTCLWKDANDCVFDYGFCLANTVTGCSWKRNRMMLGCIRRLDLAGNNY